ncbi:MAG: hypothetical protein Q9163_002985 [Psora crenata]
MAAEYQTPVFPPLSAPKPVGLNSAIPSGTFVPGTKVQVGRHRVVIEKYLSEGGFAHVYLVRLPKPVDGEDIAVLKRVAVPDKETLANMRTEVETMKKLKGQRHIVTYIDSHASQLKGGGYEVFLLMEYCNGGGLIDFMNTRLQNRLTEPEVLKIFSDVAQGVACMHYLRPPLLHRDLKVENVLIAKSGSVRMYKLCDFGSTSHPRPAAANAAEGRLIEEDVQKHTTLQYRSPEMVDVYRKQSIDEKSDIWALGVLLYKLCYYKTPFEEQGQMAILNASFKFPGYPSFSDKLKQLIGELSISFSITRLTGSASMLRENPRHRPNIYQLVREVSFIRGIDVPIKDIYAGQAQSEAPRSQHVSSPEPNNASPPVIGAVRTPVSREREVIPDIVPMRRGRPTKANGDANVPKPSSSPLRAPVGDPFKALDLDTPLVPDGSLFDDASARFPALDDFSILHDKGSKFAFSPKTELSKGPAQELSQRVTNALADDAFASQTKSSSDVLPKQSQPVERASASISSVKPPNNHITQSRTTSRPLSLEHQPRQKSNMVSTGTMTSTPPQSPTLRPQSVSNRPFFRVPSSSSAHRSLSQPRVSDTSGMTHSPAPMESIARPSLLDHRSKSHIATADAFKSSRTSLDSVHRQSYMNDLNDGVYRSKSVSSKATRPNARASSKPNILRRLSRERPHLDGSSQEVGFLTPGLTGKSEVGEEAVKINSNVEYLKMMEEEDSSKRKEKRLSGGSKHTKRASMPSVSLSGTKQLLAGRFGEAFRKFETNNGPERRESSPSPTRGPSYLTPIAGSEATDGRSDDGNVLEESEELPPEVRRELERRRLSEEERRVADGAAAYRQYLAEGGDTRTGPNSKAATIQSKVKSLLDESARASPSPTKIASGYGRFTDRQASPDLQAQLKSHDLPTRTSSRQAPAASDAISPYSLNVAVSPDVQPHKPSSLTSTSQPHRMSAPPSDNNLSRPPYTSLDIRKTAGPPKPQPKPHALRTGDRPSQPPTKPPPLAAPKLLAQKQPFQPTTTYTTHSPRDDWETNFSKRYPDLSGLEMVETEIDDQEVGLGEPDKAALSGREMRVRDV